LKFLKTTPIIRNLKTDYENQRSLNAKHANTLKNKTKKRVKPTVQRNAVFKKNARRAMTVPKFLSENCEKIVKG